MWLCANCLTGLLSQGLMGTFTLSLSHYKHIIIFNSQIIGLNHASIQDFRYVLVWTLNIAVGRLVCRHQNKSNRWFFNSFGLFQIMNLFGVHCRPMYIATFRICLIWYDDSLPYYRPISCATSSTTNFLPKFVLHGCVEHVISLLQTQAWKTYQM